MLKGMGAVGRLVVVLVTMTMLASGVTACGDESEDDLPPPASPQPEIEATATTTLSPKDAEAAKEILAAFDSYMEAYIELSTEGVPGGTEETLDRLEGAHIGGEVWIELTDEVLTPNYLAGRATRGTITWDATVEEIDWEHSYESQPDDVVPRATLQVCVDETRWTAVDLETKEVVEGPGGRYVSTVSVTWRDEDPDRPEREPRWQVAFREDRDEPC